MDTGERRCCFDLLRVAASFAVMLQHIATHSWADAEIHTLEWNTFNIYDSAMLWAVPVFVMISGAVFLGRDYPLEKLFRKNLLRLASAFLFWSVLYALADGWYGWFSFGARVLKGHYHMWFLYMIAGLYLVMPLLREIARSERLTRYFLLLSLVFTVLIPQSAGVAALFSLRLAELIQTWAGKMHLFLPLGYTGYFLLGYCLSRKEIPARLEKTIYLLGLLGFGVTALGTAGASLWMGWGDKTFYDPLSLNVLLESAAVFVFFMKRFPNGRVPEGARERIRRLDEYSFGAYLVHPLLLALLERAGLEAMTFFAPLSVPLLGLTVFAASYILSALLCRVPVLSRYIV